MKQLNGGNELPVTRLEKKRAAEEIVIHPQEEKGLSKYRKCSSNPKEGILGPIQESK